VPTLRRAISFDPVGDGAAAFDDLLNSPAGIPKLPRPAPTDLSTIGYTSGTTGHQQAHQTEHMWRRDGDDTVIQRICGVLGPVPCLRRRSYAF
jgi:hypothetical protein